MMKTDVKNRQKRLRELINQHGWDAVAGATGWTMATLNQYRTAKKLPAGAINEHRLNMAEQQLTQ